MRRQKSLKFTASHFPTIEIVHTNFRASILREHLRAWGQASTIKASTTKRVSFENFDFEFACNTIILVTSGAVDAI